MFSLVVGTRMQDKLETLLEWQPLSVYLDNQSQSRHSRPGFSIVHEPFRKAEAVKKYEAFLGDAFADAALLRRELLMRQPSTEPRVGSDAAGFGGLGWMITVIES